MADETIELGKLFITGISVRTTNQNGQSQKDMAEIWQKFFAENISSQIPNKVNDDIYCVYTDYESDFNGFYRTILGSKVNSPNDISEVLICKTIPAAKYLSFISEGKLPDCVVATLTHIGQSPVNRKYLADFDVYGYKS